MPVIKTTMREFLGKLSGPHGMTVAMFEKNCHGAFDAGENLTINVGTGGDQIIISLESIKDYFLAKESPPPPVSPEPPAGFEDLIPPAPPAKAEKNVGKTKQA